MHPPTGWLSTSREENSGMRSLQWRVAVGAGRRAWWGSVAGGERNGCLHALHRAAPRWLRSRREAPLMSLGPLDAHFGQILIDMDWICPGLIWRLINTHVSEASTSK